ncbi:piggyBac transposable element-derived protein 4 [Misgurnus anguillicaudatus]|uniref:piggyBac transposable element-derived protein 4 n=1 Tax=Misgurnus anguillicaudatus TaxID=75329 RepID=UPI003CCF8E3D
MDHSLLPGDDERDLADTEIQDIEQASETLDNTESGPDYHATNEEGFAEAGPLDVNYQSQDGNILWSPSPPPQTAASLPDECVIKKTPGPSKFACSHVEDVKSSFDLFFSNDMKKILCTLTNEEGKRVLGKGWRELDWIDLQGYIGLLILAGVYRSRHEALSSLWHAETGRPIFRATMKMSDFQAFSRTFCLSNKDKRQEKHDKLAEIRDIWEKWIKRLRSMYNPGANVTVDEGMVRFRGRCPFKQFIPHKLGKYGMKVWAACDARTSYVLSMQVHTGEPAYGQPEKDEASRLVLNMTSGLQGQTITCHNYFTSYTLGQKLLKKKLTMIGKVEKNKTELPLALLTYHKRAPCSSMFAFTDTHTVVSYYSERKRMLFMSTHHKDDTVSIEDDKKPSILLDYNRTKDAVNNLYKVLDRYSCKRSTSRWSMAIFYSMLDVSAYNAFVVWKEVNPLWNQGKSYKRRLFLEELGSALVFPLMERRQFIPRTPASLSVLMEAQHLKRPLPCLPKRKRCHVCDKEKKKQKNLHDVPKM